MLLEDIYSTGFNNICHLLHNYTVIYDCNMFIVQATTVYFFFARARKRTGDFLLSSFVFSHLTSELQQHSIYLYGLDLDGRKKICLQFFVAGPIL
jgi:hypothetical protein